MQYSINYRKILMSASVIAFVSALVFGGTQAFFSDEETSTGNLFAAGAIDLLVDSEAHYAGLVCSDDGVWVYSNDDQVTTREDLVGQSCGGTWEESDLGPQHRFFDYGDLKPGDYGENTISLHVIDNDAYACAVIDNMQDNDNGLTEPEEESGDNTGGVGEGELSQELRFFAWSDNGGNAGESNRGNNVWDPGEPMLFSNEEGPASDVIDGVVYPLYTPDMNNGAVLQGTTTEYIGLYWCYGDIDVNEDGNELTCDGAGASNMTQTDSMSADITFYVEQARNNEDFECPALEDFEEEQPVVGAQELAGYEAPACDVIVDDSFNENITGEEYMTIQGAIDDTENVEDGSVICVEDGTYDEFSVDRPLTIAGLSNPFDGTAEVNPSSGSVTELALVTSSDVTITGLKFDGGGQTMEGSQAAGVQVSPGDGDIDNVNIVYNVISNLAADHSNAANKGIQWWTADGSGYALTNSSFSHNLIENISSESKGGYGVQTVGEMHDVTIAYNTISDIDGAWGAGIALDSLDAVDTSGVSVDHNHIMDNIWAADGGEPLSVQVEHNVDQTGIVVNTNNLEGLLHGGGGGGAASGPEVNAEFNWWGDTDPSDDTYGPVDYVPFETSAYPTS